MASISAVSSVTARMRSSGVAARQNAASISSASLNDRATPPVQVARRRAARSLDASGSCSQCRSCSKQLLDGLEASDFGDPRINEALDDCEAGRASSRSPSAGGA
jgi:hypothetical protein